MPQTSSGKPGLSVFFPAYNDSGTIASLVIAALQTARQLTSDFEVIVVNDGSADSTAQIADELARTAHPVPLRQLRQRGGGGGARARGPPRRPPRAVLLPLRGRTKPPRR